jgi:hypothetical protein
MRNQSLLSAIKELEDRVTVPLKQIPEMLESRDHWGMEDARTVGRAMAAMIRQILKDPTLMELIRLAEQLRLLRPLNNVFNRSTEGLRIAQVLGEEFWDQHPSAIQSMQNRVQELLKATEQKRTLIRYLAENMGEYEEYFELPEVEAVYPPSEVLLSSSGGKRSASARPRTRS